MNTNCIIDRKTVDKTICHGKPCIRGLKYLVETFLELLASGMTNPGILEDLETQDIDACLIFPANLSKVKTKQQ